MTLLQCIRSAARIARKYESKRRGELPSIDKSICWVCGYSSKLRDSMNLLRRTIQTAHIMAVEEAPEKENNMDNLIPLCSGGSVGAVYKYLETVGQETISDDWMERINVGCHNLYDEGLISRENINSARKWQGADISITRQFRSIKSIRPLLPKEYGSVRGLRLKSQESWKVFQSNANLLRAWDPNQANELTQCITKACDSIKLERRRSANNAAIISRARAELALNECCLSDALKSILEGHLSGPSKLVLQAYQRLPYEAALAFMAAESGKISRDDDLVRAKKVEQLLIKSVKLGKKARLVKEPLFSGMELFHSRLLHYGRLGHGSHDQIKTELKNIINEAKISDEIDYDSLRWDVNWLLHQAKYHVLFLDEKNAQKCINLAREKRNVGKGWTAMQRIHINIIEGMALALENEIAKAIPKLVRAITAMAGGRSKRPESVVDTICCLANVLATKYKSSKSFQSDYNTLIDISSNINDGRSGIWTSTHSNKLTSI